MKVFFVIAVLGLGGGLLWAHARRSKTRKFWREGNYMQQIASLAPSEKDALKLPALKPLRADRNRRALFGDLRRVK